MPFEWLALIVPITSIDVVKYLTSARGCSIVQSLDFPKTPDFRGLNVISVLGLEEKKDIFLTGRFRHRSPVATRFLTGRPYKDAQVFANCSGRCTQSWHCDPSSVS